MSRTDMSLNLGIAELETDAVSNTMAEADHRIANHLAILGSYVRLKGLSLAERDQAPNAEDVRRLTQLIIAQIEAISDLHRVLSDQGHPDMLDLSVPLSKVCKAMQASVAGNINIVASLEKDCEITLQSILPLTQICAELITNAVKHGCNSKGEGDIRVSCRKSSAGTTLVEVRDFGPGLSEPPPAIRVGGLGLRLIDSLVGQVDGCIEYISTSQGLTVRVELPAAMVENVTRKRRSCRYPVPPVVGKLPSAAINESGRPG